MIVDCSINLGNLLVMLSLVVSGVWQVSSMRTRIDGIETKIGELRNQIEERIEKIEQCLNGRIELAERAQTQLSASFGLVAGIVDRHDVYIHLMATRCLGDSTPCPTGKNPTKSSSSTTVTTP